MKSILSGLQLQDLRLDVSSNNIANVMSHAFQASQVVALEQSGGVRGVVVPGGKPGGKKATSDPADYVGSAVFLESDVDLLKETITQMSALAAYRANSQIVRSQDEIMGALVRIGA